VFDANITAPHTSDFNQELGAKHIVFLNLPWNNNTVAGEENGRNQKRNFKQTAYKEICHRRPGNDPADGEYLPESAGLLP